MTNKGISLTKCTNDTHTLYRHILVTANPANTQYQLFCNHFTIEVNEGMMFYPKAKQTVNNVQTDHGYMITHPNIIQRRISVNKYASSTYRKGGNKNSVLPLPIIQKSGLPRFVTITSEVFAWKT